MAEEVYVSFETGGDDINPVGDVANTEIMQAVRFTTSALISCPSASVFINEISETPDGDLTFRIETSVDNLPSGTLAHANATGAIAFADIAYPTTWNKCSFTPFDLPAGTYWLTIQIPAQGRNDGWGILCDTDGIGWVAEQYNFDGEWWSDENVYISYFRIYREVVESKFRQEICHKGIPLGFQVRRQINKEFIYRIKCGTQEKYPYFVPANPQTEAQQAWRAKFTAGIAAAKLLTPTEIAAYKKIAYRKKGQTWHSCFMSWYLWKESHT